MVDTVVVQTPETTGEAPDEHNQRMIDKANGITPPADDLTPTGDRPAWLPEKFKTVEDMAKAYSELEKKQSNPSDPQVPSEPVDTSTVDDKTVSEELNKNGMSLEEFSKEFESKGSLSEESYSKLLAAGYDKSLVDNYISGQQAKASLYEVELKAVAGGSEQYTKMVEWAKASMTQSEVDAYNLSVSSTNTDAAKLAISGLKARYEAANGREPSLVKGNNTAAVADKYASRNEITTAMKDPRYAKDPAYRAQVIAKVGRSNF